MNPRFVTPALLALAACTPDDNAIPLHFDGPAAAAVLPGLTGPFDEPVGYIANARGGWIVPLDLKHGRFLTDDPTASFLRASYLPTGAARLLSDVVVVSDATRVTAWALDAASGRVLRVPHVTGLDAAGNPVEPEPTAGEPVFVDADGSGDAPTLDAIEVRAGYTTSEDWSVEHDGSRWWVKGSASGGQGMEPVVGERWHSDAGELAFVLSGSATAGDRFELRTDSGLAEIVPGARPLGLVAVGGRGVVSTAAGWLEVYDGLDGTSLGAIFLGEGAQPGRMAAAADGRVFVADGSSAAAYVVSGLDADVASAAARTIATAGPIVDVAHQVGEGIDGAPFDRLFVAPLGAQRVDVYDLAADVWVDPNPVTPAIEGVVLGGPITGLAASTGEVRLAQMDSNGAYPLVPTVVVSTGDGYVFQLDASTGCAVVDERGPHAPNPSVDGNVDYADFDDVGVGSDASLVIDEDSGEQVVVSPCGGVVRGETWTVTYDATSLDWEVEGSLSSVQTARARSDERYLSDDGAVSFLVASGPRPATDGDRFTFTTSSGLLSVRCADNDGDGACGQGDSAFEGPARAATFFTENGPTGGGWDPYDRREYALLPVASGDVVARVRLDVGDADVRWQ